MSSCKNWSRPERRGPISGMSLAHIVEEGAQAGDAALHLALHQNIWRSRCPAAGRAFCRWELEMLLTITPTMRPVPLPASPGQHIGVVSSQQRGGSLRRRLPRPPTKPLPRLRSSRRASLTKMPPRRHRRHTSFFTQSGTPLPSAALPAAGAARKRQQRRCRHPMPEEPTDEKFSSFKTSCKPAVSPGPAVEFVLSDCTPAQLCVLL